MAEFIEVVRIITSWQMVLLAIVVITYQKFEEPIKQLIPKLSVRANWKDFAITAESQRSAVRIEEATPPTPEVDQSQPKAAEIPTQELQDAATSWRLAAYVWEYRYLNFFLKGNTQRALNILYTFSQPIPLSLASNLVAQYAPDPNEQKAVLDAMTAHHLVQIQGETISLTPKGREYVEFRGKPAA